jgi:hypothetical protein
MSRLIYATHVQCDGCGAVASMPPPSAEPASSPPGWLPPGLGVHDDYRSSIINDLCDVCMRRPLGELLEAVLVKSAESP